MSTPSEAHRLANHLFEMFLENNEALKPDELTAANVYKTEDINQEGFSRIEIEGEIEAGRLYKCLEKTARVVFIYLQLL